MTTLIPLTGRYRRGFLVFALAAAPFAGLADEEPAPVIVIRHLDAAEPSPAEPAADFVAAAEARIDAAAGNAPAVPDAGPFPARAALDDAVGFWQQVFATWRLDQAALHDARHLALVYEIVDLPGGSVPDWTDAQRAVARQRREQLEARLRTLAAKVRTGQPLGPDEEPLRRQIVAAAGEAAIEGAAERVRAQRGMRERFRRGLEISGRYDALFREIFRAQGVPEDLACLPHVESSFQAAARSSAGAVGVWQFTRPAARRYMTLTKAVDERLDPVAAAEGAARYLRDAYAKLGDWGLAITSYNHGVGGMLRAKAAHGADIERIVRRYDGPLFGFASRNFYAEFLAVREIAAAPLRFFPEGIAYEPPPGADRVTLDRATPAATLARQHGRSVAELAALNPAWSRSVVQGKAALPAGIKVWIPATAVARIPAAAVAPSPAAGAPSPAPEPAPQVAGTPSDHVVHTVRRGDTLGRIAARYGVKLADLLGVNRVTERAVLRPGQRLRVPLAVAP